MQKPPRSSDLTRHNQTFLRRLLFPYSGTEPLSLKQSLRVLLAWIVLVPLLMSLCTLLLLAIFAYPLQKIVTFLLFTFFSGFFIFGGLGVLVVIANNTSARIRLRQAASNDHNTTGGRYGS